MVATADRTKRNGKHNPEDSLKDIKSERSHLGRLLCSLADAGKRTECLTTVVQRGLMPQVFFLPAHELLMREILAYAEETGQAPDWLTIDQRIRSKPGFDELGEDYVRDLA